MRGMTGFYYIAYIVPTTNFRHKKILKKVKTQIELHHGLEYFYCTCKCIIILDQLLTSSTLVCFHPR